MFNAGSDPADLLITPLLGTSAAGNVHATTNPVTGRSILQGTFDSWDEVFVIGGQSNADGRGVIDSTVSKPSPAVLLYDKGSNIRIADEPAGVQASGWINNIPAGLTPGAPAHSFGVPMGKNIAAITGVKPLIVPCAIGSSRMNRWYPPVGTPDLTTLFGAMVIRANDVKTPERQPVFCWFGHESDNYLATENLATGAYTKEYIQYWHGLITDIRLEFPGAPILYAQLAPYGGTSAPAAQKTRLTGQAQLATENGTGAETGAAAFAAAVSVDTNATNVVTITGETIKVVGDGNVPVGFSRAGLTPGQQYRIKLRVEGTGLWKTSGALVLGSQQADRQTLFFTAASSSISFLRNANGSAVDLTFVFEELVTISAYTLKDTYMVVSHDLPRNAGADDVHLLTEGQKEIGKRFALAYAERVLGITTIDGTGPRLVSVTSTDATHTKVKFTQAIAAAKAGESNYSDGTDSLLRVYDGGVEKSVSDVSIDGADGTALIITHASCAGVRVVTYGERSGQDSAWRKGVIYNTLSNPLPAPMFGPVVSV